MAIGRGRNIMAMVQIRPRARVEWHTIYLDRTVSYLPIRVITKRLHVQHETGTPYSNHPRVKAWLDVGCVISMCWYDWPQPSQVEVDND